MKRYLITSALPYANGPLHFGHLAGVYLPADVFYRHTKLMGRKAIHISGSDEHGVAIMLNAQKAGKEYKEYVDEWHDSHKKLFDKYKVFFDFFGQTSADYHAEEVVPWFKAIHEKGLIGTKDSQQLYCNDCKNHLPDRFVKGQCYSCDYEDARGDECPNCGIIIDPVKLKKPVCQICGSNNIEEVTVTQYYLLLSKFEKEFKEYLSGRKPVWRKTVFPFVESLIKDGLHDRAISRDLDWGIDVPLDEAEGKKLYVWFDAPIGYVSNTKKMIEEKELSEDYLKDWWTNPDSEIVHFIGKDNIIFHSIIFPCMSMASGRALPATDVPANQYLNLEGKQFSKSAGWYVDADEAVEQFGPDALRYYLFSILPEGSDSSFTWEGFQARVNGELANNIGNLVNRCLKFWAKNWADGLPSTAFQGLFDSAAEKRFKDVITELHGLLDNKQIKKGLETLMALGQEVNTYFSDKAPWAEFKTDPEAASKTIAETGLQILMLGILFEPFLPDLSNNILTLFGEKLTPEIKNKIYRGEIDCLRDLVSDGYQLTGKPKALVPKIEDSVIESLKEELGKKG